MPKNTKNLIVVLTLLVLCNSALIAQEYATGCEENEARLDTVWSEMEKHRDDSGVLLIVARLGAGERSLETSRRRLHNAREYLMLRGVRKISKDRIIIALGERTSGLGRVEFYLGGKLVDKLLVRKNKNLCVDCCQNHQFKPYRNKGVMW
jgi:hypothetical protein